MAYVGVLLYCLVAIVCPQEWTDSFKGQPVDMVVFSFVAAVVVLSPKLEWWSRVATHPLSRIVVLHIVVTVLTVVISFRFDALVGQVFYYLKLLATFLAFAIVVDTPRKIQGVLIWVIILTTIVAYQGIGLAETGVGLAGQELYWGGRIKWVGMYNGANVLCMLFVIAMAFVMQALLGPWGWAIKIVAFIAGGFIVNGIYLTNSRGGFLAFVCVVGLSLFLKHKESLSRFSPKGLVAGALVVFLLLQAAPSRMDSLADKEHSAAGRIDAWQEGLEMLKAHPIWGVGKGEWLNHHFRLAHNSFVQMMGETGLVGLFFWIAVIYLMMRTLIQALKRFEDSHQQSLVTAIIVAVSAYLITSWFITTTEFDWLYIFAGLTVAIAARSDVQAALTFRDLRWIGVVTVVGVITIDITARLFYLFNG